MSGDIADPSEETDEPVTPEDMVLFLEDGTELQASMFLDKDGNETSILFDTVSVLAKNEKGWYEINIQKDSWVLSTLH